MNENYFDKILKEKLSEQTEETARPDWHRMMALLEQNGLVKGFFLGWKSIAIGVLGLLTLLNTGMFIYYFQHPSATETQLYKHQREEIIRFDTIYHYDTVIKKEMIKIYDTVYVRHTHVFLKNQYKNSKLMENVLSGANTVANFQKHFDNNNTGGISMTAKNKMLSNQKKSRPKNINYDSLLFAINKINKQMQQAQPFYSSDNSKPVSTKNTFPELHKTNKAVETHLPPYLITQKEDSVFSSKTKLQQDSLLLLGKSTSSHRKKNSLSINFRVGSSFTLGMITEDDLKKGFSYQYGINPYIFVNKHFNIFTGIFYGKIKYNLVGNSVSEKINSYPEVTESEKINEIYTNASFISIPFGAGYYLNPDSHLQLFSEAGINYYYFTQQQFTYDSEDSKEKSTTVVKKNSYQGWGSAFIGIGVAYLPRKHLFLIVKPKYQFPLNKIGVEQISYHLLSTDIMLIWKF